MRPSGHHCTVKPPLSVHPRVPGSGLLMETGRSTEVPHSLVYSLAETSLHLHAIEAYFVFFLHQIFFLKKFIKLKDQALEGTTIGELSSGGEMMAAVTFLQLFRDFDYWPLGSTVHFISE